MSTLLRDQHGRVGRDLRVSLTDRCNLRCTYCMPEQGVAWLDQPQLLTDDEMLRLIGIAVTRLGVSEIRFTGGEPLLRRGLVDIVRRTASLEPRPETSLTTNALGLRHNAQALADAGLDRVNISLDTIRPDTFAKITRRDRLHDVLAGIEAATAAGLTPVKINAVLMPGVNDEQAVELLEWAIAHGHELRFIEQMPLDADGIWRPDDMITAAQIRLALGESFELKPSDEDRGSAPAQRYVVDSGPTTVGIIASVTEPFCGDCDRVRLTADGQVRNCLFAREESDLRTPLRSGAGDEDLADLWRKAMWGKRAGHGIDDPSFRQPSRPMSAIGG